MGCGSTYDHKWTNVDLYKSGKDVIQADLTKRLPFRNNYFDVVYCSHLLEHFTYEEGQRLINEIHRVLKKGGIARIVVPDLERIAKVYLQKLNDSVEGKKGAIDDYNWILLELFDQVGRNKSGGEMLLYILNPKMPNRKFILSRVGKEAENILQTSNANSIDKIKQIIQVVRNRGIKWLVTYVHELILGVLVRIFGGKRIYRSYKEGIFRSSGEIHKHMYDRYSLAQILKEAGFENIKKTGARESIISNFNDYQLDVIGSKTRKPDSLFMEAVKP